MAGYNSGMANGNAIDTLRFPIGDSDFEDLRRSGSVYVDKSALISRIIKDGAKSILFTRPRRFGKTTAINMLASFFDIRRDSRDVFDGLEVMDDSIAVEQWMNAHPVIALSFKDVDGHTFEDLRDSVAWTVRTLFSLNRHLLEWEGLDSDDRALFSRIAGGRATDKELRVSLSFLARLLSSCHGRGVIVLIDEYDVPLAKAQMAACHDKMLPLIRTILTSVLKDCPFVSKAVLTGCLRIAKESIFTGLNNLSVNSLAGDDYCDSFGFTEEEVDSLLALSGLQGHKKTIEHWYDGYRIGKSRLFCPWDCLCYLKDLSLNKDRKPQNYWANPSGNAEVADFLSRSRRDISKEYDILSSGGSMEVELTDELTYRNLWDDDDNVWSLLFATGYLTLASPFTPNGLTRVRIPNEEVRLVFMSSFASWVHDSAKRKPDFVESLRSALWRGDGQGLSSLVSARMSETLSYHDYSEASYHALLLGYFGADATLVVSSERESGLGRADIVIEDPSSGSVAVLELKCTRKASEMEHCADAALAQIAQKQYCKPYGDRPLILSCGVCFCRKSVLFKFSGQ